MTSPRPWTAEERALHEIKADEDDPRWEMVELGIGYGQDAAYEALDSLHVDHAKTKRYTNPIWVEYVDRLERLARSVSGIHAGCCGRATEPDYACAHDLARRIWVGRPR